MAAAFVGATDMMVSDYDGNQPDAPVKYKCIYCKFSATRKIGVERLFQTIPQWHSQFGNVSVFWDATMQMDNKPPKAKRDQRPKTPQQQVFMEGNVELNKVEAPAKVANLLPVADSVITMDEAHAFAESASSARANSQITLRHHCKLLRKHTPEQWMALLHEFMYPDDVANLVQSPFATPFFQFYIQNNMDMLEYAAIRMLASCCLPWKGFTLAKAKANFPGEVEGHHMQMLPRFHTGQFCICNQDPVTFREIWPELGIVQDGPTMQEEAEGWEGMGVWTSTHQKVLGVFFNVNAEGRLDLFEHGCGLIFTQHLELFTLQQMDQCCIHDKAQVGEGPWPNASTAG